MLPSDTYDELRAPFDHVHKLQGKFDYITGEQCVSRLNDALGAFNWSFSILEHGQTDSEIWVRGELVATDPETANTVRRQQFGGQPVKKSRDTGEVLSLADDMKAAATDCLKRCAVSLGVALYLYEKDEPHGATRSNARRAPAPMAQRPSTVAPASSEIKGEIIPDFATAFKAYEAAQARGLKWAAPPENAKETTYAAYIDAIRKALQGVAAGA